MSVPTIQGANGQTLRLGRIRPVAAFDYGKLRVLKYADGSQRVALRLGAYLDSAAVSAPLPASTNWREKGMASIRRMYLNDTYGDCVIASKYHTEGVWSGNDAGAAVLGTDQEVLSAYHGICGPGDNGCIISDVLDAWKSQGLSFGGVKKKIDAYVSCDNANKDLVRAGIAIFGGGGCVGIDLPSAWGSSADGSDWDVTSSGIVGGHDVAVLDYDSAGVWIATWAGTRRITWPAFTSKKWITELYFALGPDWYGSDKLAPSGLNADALAADLAQLGAGVVPNIDPGPAMLDFGVLA